MSPSAASHVPVMCPLLLYAQMLVSDRHFLQYMSPSAAVQSASTAVLLPSIHLPLVSNPETTLEVPNNRTLMLCLLSQDLPKPYHSIYRWLTEINRSKVLKNRCYSSRFSPRKQDIQTKDRPGRQGRGI